MRRTRLINLGAAICCFLVLVLLVLYFAFTPSEPPPLREGMDRAEVDQLLGKPVVGIILEGGQGWDDPADRTVYVYHDGLPNAGREIRVICDRDDHVVSWSVKREAPNPSWVYHKIEDSMK